MSCPSGWRPSDFPGAAAIVEPTAVAGPGVKVTVVFEPAVQLNVNPTVADPTFPRNNPNRLRSLVGTFAMTNQVQFARPDGEGFRFVTEFVADVDKRNPQVAARVLTAFRVWPRLEDGRHRSRRANMTAALRRTRDGHSLRLGVHEEVFTRWTPG